MSYLLVKTLLNFSKEEKSHKCSDQQAASTDQRSTHTLLMWLRSDVTDDVVEFVIIG
jgi:hypothetical protein